MNASSRRIKKIETHLKTRDIECEEAKTEEYLILRDNPKDVIPEFLMSGIKIIELGTKDAIKFMKNYGSLTAMLSRKAEPPEVGQFVRITGGDYKDLRLKGIVKSVGNKTCGVETMVWGNLVKVNVGFNDIEIVGGNDL